MAEERIRYIMSRCDKELKNLVDKLDLAVKEGKVYPWLGEALKKSLTTYADCVDTTEQEFR